MKTMTQLVKTVTIELTHKEAEMLKDMIQNGDDPSREAEAFRHALFDSLNTSLTS